MPSTSVRPICAAVRASGGPSGISGIGDSPNILVRISARTFGASPAHGFDPTGSPNQNPETTGPSPIRSDGAGASAHPDGSVTVGAVRTSRADDGCLAEAVITDDAAIRQHETAPVSASLCISYSVVIQTTTGNAGRTDKMCARSCCRPSSRRDLDWNVHRHS